MGGKQAAELEMEPEGCVFGEQIMKHNDSNFHSVGDIEPLLR